MYTIEKKEHVTGLVYPDAEYLQDYQNSDVESLISTAGIEAVIGMNTRELGDSGIYILIKDTGMRGDDGINQLKAYTESFVSIIKEAVPKMSREYAEFYQFFLNDYENNGLVMPMYGKL